MWYLGDSNHDGPYLLEEVMSLKGLDVVNDQGQPSEPVDSAPVPTEAATQSPAVEERKPAEKKLVKPKWLKMWLHLFQSGALVCCCKAFPLFFAYMYV